MSALQQLSHATCSGTNTLHSQQAEDAAEGAKGKASSYLDALNSEASDAAETVKEVSNLGLAVHLQQQL